MKIDFSRWATALLLVLMLGLPLAGQSQGVGIGTATPDASAALDVSSTARGLLVPRLTAAQRAAIITPATGLLVFQTDGAQAGFWFNAGPPAAPAWTFINPAGGGGGGDNLGNHTATTALNLQANALTGTGADLGAAVGVGVRADGGLNLGQNTAGNNVFLGYQSGQATTPTGTLFRGRYNVFSGYQAGASNTTGGDNVFSGYRSGSANTTGVGNLFVGSLSGEANTTASFNQFVGYTSGFNNGTGGGNQFSGYESGYLNTAGNNNQFSGYQSGFNNGTGGGNYFSGYQSGYSNTTGTGNTYVGFFSGRNAEGSGNTVLGAASGSFTNLNNTTALGSQANVFSSNTVVLGNPNVTALRCAVPLTVTSDARFKYDVHADVPGLAFVTRLRPVTYRFDTARLSALERTGALPARGAPDPAAPVQTGFLAQEVEAAAQALGYRFDGVRAPATARDHYGLAYAQFVVPLVRAVQELSQQVNDLKTQNAALQTAAAQVDADHAALLRLQAQVTRLLGDAPVAQGAQARK